MRPSSYRNHSNTTFFPDKASANGKTTDRAERER